MDVPVILNEAAFDLAVAEVAAYVARRRPAARDEDDRFDQLCEQITAYENLRYELAEDFAPR